MTVVAPYMYDESTILGFFLNRATRYRDRDYIKSRFDADGRVTEDIHTVSWGEMDEMIRALTVGINTLGVAAFDRVAILSPNSPRWAMTTFAILALRATFVPIYPTSKTEDVWWCLYDAGARVVFVHSQEHLESVLDVRPRLEHLEWIVVMDSSVTTDGKGVISFNDLLASGRAIAEYREKSELRLKELRADDLAAIVYTSGTTGRSKGVMLTNKNFISQLRAADEFEFTPDDVWFCHLPLCHVLGLSVDFLNASYQGGTLFITESLAPAAIRRNIADCRPTVMTSVPRMWEKLYIQIGAMVRQRSRLVQKLFYWAVASGRAHYLLKTENKPIPLGVRFKAWLAGRILKKLRKKGGLERLKICVTGGGPIHPELLVFFGAMGINLYQGYGLTETAPVTHASTPMANKIGWIGKPIPETECKVADDGELLIRGPQVMKGYWGDLRATAEVFTEDGFLKTGDIAEIDDQGFVRITDRKKDLIITRGGKNIAPQPIQNSFDIDPYIEQICVVGDARKYLTALIVPNFDTLEKWAEKQGLAFSSREALAKMASVKALYEESIQRVNATLSKVETIKRFAILSKEFTVEGGELTPTMKMKRSVIEKKYKAVIDSLYDDELSLDWHEA